MDKTWSILKREVPDKVEEIYKSLKNCIDSVEKTRHFLSDRLYKYNDLDQYTEAAEILEAKSMLLALSNHLKEIKSNCAIEEEEISEKEKNDKI